MRRILLSMFFLSGFCALVYQVVWVRQMSLVFGVTSLAVATVLSSFMGGLALGSWGGGRVVDRVDSPLRLFGLLEIGIGAYALLFPVLLMGMRGLFILMYRQWEMSFYVFSILRFALAFMTLIVPTVLMGATLPVLARALVRRVDHVASDLGRLYAANNCGAVAGALAAGFVLIQALGVRGSSLLAAAVSIGVGVAAFAVGALGREGREEPSGRPTPSAEAASAPSGVRYPHYAVVLALAVFGIEGFTSLAYEVVWTRILAGMGSVVSVYAFSLVAATSVAGLALGSLLMVRVIDRCRDPFLWLAGIEFAIGLSALALLPLFKVSPYRVMMLLGLPGAWVADVAATALWLMVLMLAPTTLMGMTFPVVGRIYANDLSQLGRRVGRIGFLDTIGSLFGAFAGGFILVPLLGMRASVLAVVAVNLVLGLAVLLAHPHLARSRRLAWATAALLPALVLYAVIPRQHLYVPSRYMRDRVTEVIHYDEGTEATVWVCQWFEGYRSLVVDARDVAGSERTVKTNQIAQAALPLLLYESMHGRMPKRALQIGLGSGHSSRVLSSLDDLEQIHCVELNPSIRDAARDCFADLNEGVFEDPRFRLVFQDARTFVLAEDARYDLITNDAFHPIVAGCAGLYSRDFFALCRQRLAEDGIMSVWMPLWHLSVDDLRMMARSFREVFPHATLWYVPNSPTRHAVLIGTPGRLRIDLERFCARVSDPALQQHLATVDIGDPYVLLSSLLMDEFALERFCREARVNSDNHPLLEYSAPRMARRGHQTTVREVVFAMAQGRRSILPYLTGLGATPDRVAAVEERASLHYEVAGHLLHGFLLFEDGHRSEARRLAERAYALDPDGPSTRLLLARCRCWDAHELASLGRFDDGIRMCREAIALRPDHLAAYMQSAKIHASRRQYGEAISALQAALEKAPRYLAGRLFLSQILYADGRTDEARTELQRLLEDVPDSAFVRRSLQMLR